MCETSKVKQTKFHKV